MTCFSIAGIIKHARLAENVPENFQTRQTASQWQVYAFFEMQGWPLSIMLNAVEMISPFHSAPD